MTLPALNEAQESALADVCALFLSETRYATDPTCSLPPEFRAVVLRRRDVCALVTGGAQ